MSLIATLARLQALDAGRAQPAATVLHRHLGDRPMVLIPLAAAGGGPDAPLAAMFGTDREEPRLLTIPQPLDRDARSAFLAELADALLPFLESAADDVEEVPGKEKDPETGEQRETVRELCRDAPQLIVPGPAAVRFLGMIGRATRFRRTEADPDPGPYPAPPRVPLLGRWLTHYRERAEVPGSSLLLPMTQLLSRHWATGQSALEDEHLGALLAWIDPPEGRTGAEAALHAETARDSWGLLLCPPAGPATDPGFDQRALAPAVARYDAAREVGDARAAAARAAEIAELLESRVLRPTWDAVWRGLDLLRTLPPAAHLPERWESDRWSYTAHRDRIRAGEAPQPIRDDAVGAARRLAQRERDQSRLEIQEALDDPLVMAARRLAGEALVGEVTAVEQAWTTGRAPKPRPLVTVRTSDRPHAEPGTRAYRPRPAEPDEAGNPGRDRAQKAEVVAADHAAGEYTLRLLDGMGRRRDPEPGSVPEPGEQVCFTLFELSVRQSAPLPEPEDTPWTHGGPPVPPAAAPEAVPAAPIPAAIPAPAAEPAEEATTR